MAILDLCTRNVVFCEKLTTLRQAAQMMKKHNVGNLVVVEHIGSKKPIGIITDRDIVMGVSTENHTLMTHVWEVMSNDIVTVPTNQGISDVVDLMEKKAVRRVIVLDKTACVVGIVSTDDILQLVAQEMKGLGNLFQRQQQSEKSERLLQESFLT